MHRQIVTVSHKMPKGSWPLKLYSEELSVSIRFSRQEHLMTRVLIPR